MLPLTIYADYLDLPDGLARESSWGCSPRRPNCDLWCEIWRRIADLGGLGSELQIRHVSGHQMGMSFEARGNRWADFAAAQGRDLHSVREPEGHLQKLGLDG
eukprot:3014868-Pyramimonas_sp.AAC.1